MLETIEKKKTTSTAALCLPQRIDLTTQARQINSLARQHRNRLDCPRKTGSPYDLAAGGVQGERTPRLDTHNSIADHRRRSDHLAHKGLPPQPSGLSLDGIEEPIFAAEKRQVTPDGGG